MDYLFRDSFCVILYILLLLFTRNAQLIRIKLQREPSLQYNISRQQLISSRKRYFNLAWICIKNKKYTFLNCGFSFCFFFFFWDTEEITNNVNQRQENRKDNNVEHMAHENLASVLSPWILWKKKTFHRTRELFKNFLLLDSLIITRLSNMHFQVILGKLWKKEKEKVKN